MPVRTKLSPVKPNAFVDFGFPGLLSTCLPTVQCHRTFDTEARLKLHETFHSVGHKCGDCDLSYKSRTGLRRHIKNSHENVMVHVPGLGFGLFNGEQQKKTKKKVEKPSSYMCTKCGFKTKWN